MRNPGYLYHQPSVKFSARSERAAAALRRLVADIRRAEEGVPCPADTVGGTLILLLANRGLPVIQVAGTMPVTHGIG